MQQQLLLEQIVQAANKPALGKEEKVTFPFCSFHLLNLIIISFFLPHDLWNTRDSEENGRKTLGDKFARLPSPNRVLVAFRTESGLLLGSPTAQESLLDCNLLSAGMGHKSSHIMGTNLTFWCSNTLFCLGGLPVSHKTMFPLLGDKSSCPSTTPCPHQNQQLPSSAFPVQASPKAACNCTMPPKYKCPMMGSNTLFPSRFQSQTTAP